MDSKTAAISSRWPHRNSSSASSTSTCGVLRDRAWTSSSIRIGSPLWLEVLMESGAAVAAQKLIGRRHRPRDRVARPARARHGLRGRGAIHDAGRRTGCRPPAAGRPAGVSRLAATTSRRRTPARGTPSSNCCVFLDAEHARLLPSRDGRLPGAVEFQARGRWIPRPARPTTSRTCSTSPSIASERREQQGYVTPAQARAFLQSARELPTRTGRNSAVQSGRPRLFPRDGVARRIRPRGPGLRDAGRSARDNRRRRRSHGRPVRGGRVDWTAPRAARRCRRRRAAAHAHPDADAVRRRARSGRLFTEDGGARLSREYDRRWMFDPGDGRLRPPKRRMRPPPRATWAWSIGRDTGSRARRFPTVFSSNRTLWVCFQVGWTILYSQVCLFAANRLIDVLGDVRCNDREIQSSLNALRIDMTRQCQAGTPWRARDALDVIAILDTPAWAALLGLIDECPVVHAALGASQAREPGRSARRPSSSSRRTARSNQSASSSVSARPLRV